MSDWMGVLRDLPFTVGPAPAGRPLHASVACYTSRRDDAEATSHTLVIRHDWIAEVPHDLEAERVAAAFGGHLSCIALIDRDVPGLREWLLRAVRLVVPSVVFRGYGDRWSVREEQECCRGITFPNALAVADHWRSPEHVAGTFGARRQQLQALTTAVLSAHLGTRELLMPVDECRRAAESCLGGTDDVEWLWQCGIHPRLVQTIHRRIGSRQPLGAHLYLGVAWHQPRIRWVIDSLRNPPPAAPLAPVDTSPPRIRSSRYGSSGNSPAWAAWAAQNWDAVDLAVAARWSGTGISRPLILELKLAGYDPEELTALAVVTRDAIDTGDRWLASE